MDYSKLGNAVKNIISYNVDITNLQNYVYTPAYSKTLTKEYIQSEYVVFEAWLKQYIASYPLTKNIKVLDFNIVSKENGFLLDLVSFEKFVETNFTVDKDPLYRYSNPNTMGILGTLVPTNESANIAFVVMSILIAFINTFAKQDRYQLIKDRSILGFYPPLKLTINIDSEPIYVVRTV